MTVDAVLRPAVRVLVVDENDATLLFQATNPDTGASFWFPPGGGIEDGENAEAAAMRELSEETGLVDFVLGPQIWHRRHVHEWRGVTVDQREQWFITVVPHFRPVATKLTDTEAIDLTGCRWWTLDELASTDETLVPLDLADRLRRLLTEGPPSQPTTIGI